MTAGSLDIPVPRLEVVHEPYQDAFQYIVWLIGDRLDQGSFKAGQLAFRDCTPIVHRHTLPDILACGSFRAD
jgi:hypothetical protein